MGPAATAATVAKTDGRATRQGRTPHSQAPDYTGVLPAWWLPRSRAFDEGLVNATNWFDPRLTMRLRNVVPRAQPHLPIVGTSMSVDDAPLRAQLFTAEEMEQHGRHLAAGHELTRRRQPRSLAAPARRQREGARRNLRAARAERRPAAPRHAGRRMAARQLLPDRGRGAHGQAPPAARLQPRAAAHRRAARVPVCRASTTSRCMRSPTATAGSDAAR